MAAGQKILKAILNCLIVRPGKLNLLCLISTRLHYNTPTLYFHYFASSVTQPLVHMCMILYHTMYCVVSKLCVSVTVDRQLIIFLIDLPGETFSSLYEKFQAGLLVGEVFNMSVQVAFT